MVKKIIYKDLVNFTETYKMLFLPYLKLFHKKEYNFIYGSKNIIRSIVNVYPYWDSQSVGLSSGTVFLVLNEKTLNASPDVYSELLNLDIVEEWWHEDYKNYEFIVLAISIDEDIAINFEKGYFSKMFKPIDLHKIWNLFEKKEGGILSPVPNGMKSAYLADEYHILCKSELYEKFIASQLRVWNFDDFKGKLKEFKCRFEDDMSEQTLNIKELSKQLQYGKQSSIKVPK